MIGRNFNSNHSFNKTEGNILMMQIKAQKNRRNRCQPIFVGTTKKQEQIGKKVYKEKLFQTTCLYNNKQSSKIEKDNLLLSARTIYTSKGKKHISPIRQVSVQRSYGKKRTPLKQSSNQNKKIIGFSPKDTFTSPYRTGRKRLDHSPVNQNRLSPGFKIIGNQ